MDGMENKRMGSDGTEEKEGFMKSPKVLVACEESQRVCMAFRERGIEAYSCDIQEPRGGHPEWHICGDVLKILNPKLLDDFKTVYGIEFVTMDHEHHFIDRWDLVIAHPPCTYITRAGARYLLKKGGIIKDFGRYEKALEGADFFMKFLLCDAGHVAVENPIPMKIVMPIPYDQIIQPYYFGDPVMKTTCLWLKRLPPLYKTNVVTPLRKVVSAKDNRKEKKNDAWAKSGARSAIERSVTAIGIANAMAKQWGDYLLKLEEW